MDIVAHTPWGVLKKRSCKKTKGQSQPQPKVPKSAPKRTSTAKAARTEAVNLLSSPPIIPMEAMTAPL